MRPVETKQKHASGKYTCRDVEVVFGGVEGLLNIPNANRNAEIVQ